MTFRDEFSLQIDQYPQSNKRTVWNNGTGGMIWPKQ